MEAARLEAEAAREEAVQKLAETGESLQGALDSLADAAHRQKIAETTALSQQIAVVATQVIIHSECGKRSKGNAT
jgi:hypothetical protein